MKEKIDYYRNHSAINQSKLKKLLGYNPSNFLNEEKEESSGFFMGSLVDCLITTPEDFDTIYYLTDFNITASENIMKICDEYIRLSESDDLLQNKDLVIKIARDNGYYKGYKDDTIYSRIYNDGLKYCSLLKKANGKIIVDKKTYDKAMSIVHSIKDTFKDIFDFDCEYQVSMFSIIDNIEVKCLIDMMKIDFDNKIVNIYDIKTMYESTAMFWLNMKKYRYDIQMAWYKTIVSNNYPGFKVNCHFIVESTENIGNPIMYTCTENLLEIGEHGIYVSKGDLFRYIIDDHQETKKIKCLENISFIEGYRQLLTKYKYYNENGFETDYRIKKHNNRALIDWNGSDELL